VASSRQGDGQFPWDAEFLDKARERLAEILQRGFLRVTLAVCGLSAGFGQPCPHPGVRVDERLSSPTALLA
jgi:hypothetical protein